jgi:hypothetical protein
VTINQRLAQAAEEATVKPCPWELGEVFSRDGVDYELIAAGTMYALVDSALDGPAAVADVAMRSSRELAKAGSKVGDHIIILRPRPCRRSKLGA